MERRPRYFVLFDMNGTLLHKSLKKIKGAREPDKLVKKIIRLYVRPDIVQLFSPVLSMEGVRVGLFSSMRRQTVAPMLDALLDFLSCKDKKESILIFDREYCIPDPLSDDPKDTLKSLDLVWDGAYAKKLGMHPHNTVLIENDVKKASRCVPNLIRMVPYGEADVLHPQPDRDSLLQHYRKYLEDMFRSATEDVREYISTHPLPVLVTKYFEQTTEEVLKAQEDMQKFKEEEGKAAEADEHWVYPDALPDKDAKMKEMLKLMEGITLSVEKQD